MSLSSYLESFVGYSSGVVDLFVICCWVSWKADSTNKAGHISCLFVGEREIDKSKKSWRREPQVL